MAKNFLTDINLSQNEIRNAVGQPLAAAPSSPKTGQFYFDSTLGKLGVYNGTSWDYMGTSEASGDVSSNTSTSVDSEVALFSGTGGKTIKRATGSGIAKLTSGVLSTATEGTDYLTASSTNTLTNKTINADNNTITNLELDNFKSGVINASPTFVGASDSNVPTTQAVKTYVDTALDAINQFTFKGGIDASTNPNYPEAVRGDVYKITVAGRIGGASGAVVTVGDTIIATDDNDGGTQAEVGDDWIIVQTNVDQATTDTLGLVQLATLADAEAKTNSQKAVVPSALTNFPVKKTFTVGNGEDTTLILTHNLNTTDVVTQVRLAANDEIVECDIINASVNTVSLGFAVAPESNAIKAVVMG